MSGGNSRVYVVGNNAYGSKLGNIGAGIHQVADCHSSRSGDFTEARLMPDHTTTFYFTHKGAHLYDEWMQNIANGVGEMKWDKDPGFISRLLLGDIVEIADTVGKP